MDNTTAPFGDFCPICHTMPCVCRRPGDVSINLQPLFGPPDYSAVLERIAAALEKLAAREQEDAK